MTDTTASAENKVDFGLKNGHYAPVIDDGEKLTYGEFKPLKGSTEISIDPEGDSNDFYADDTKYFTAVSNQGYSGKLTVARLNDEFFRDVFGEKKDETTGLQYDDTQVQPKKIALAFEFDGDIKQTRHVLYYVTCTRPSFGSSTKEDKIEPNTQELEFTAGPDPYKDRSKAKANKGDICYDVFFDTVQIPGVEPASSSTKVTGITATPTSLEGEVGGTGTFSYTLAPTDATNPNVTIKVKDESVATVAVKDNTVTVTYVKAGTTEVDGTTEDGNKTFAVAITVNEKTE